MKRRPMLVALVTLITAFFSTALSAAEWKQLFNGKDLSG
jgi:hypothetical protein